MSIKQSTILKEPLVLILTMEWARVATKAKWQTKYILPQIVRIRMVHIIVSDLYQRMRTWFQKRISVRAKWKTTIQYLKQDLATTTAMLVTTRVILALFHHHLWIIPKQPMSSRCSKCRCKWCNQWRGRWLTSRCSSWCSNNRWWCRWHWCRHRWVDRRHPCRVKIASIHLQRRRPLLPTQLLLLIALTIWDL